jgi:hypothetical protein
MLLIVQPETFSCVKWHWHVKHSYDLVKAQFFFLDQSGNSQLCPNRVDISRSAPASYSGGAVWIMTGHRQSWFRYLMVFFRLMGQGRGQCLAQYGTQLLPFTSSAVHCLLITIPFPPPCGTLIRCGVVTSPFGASQSHSLDMPHSVGLLWMSDQPDAETSTWQHTMLTRDKRHATCEIQTHNPSKWAAADPHFGPCGWPLGSALCHLTVYSPQFLSFKGFFFSATIDKVLEKVKCTVPRLLIK